VNGFNVPRGTTLPTPALLYGHPSAALSWQSKCHAAFKRGKVPDMLKKDNGSLSHEGDRNRNG